MIVVTGTVASLGHHNMTIRPKAEAQLVRCPLIELTDGRCIEGPLQMDAAIYQALQSGLELEITVYKGGLFFRRNVQSVRFHNGQLLRNRCWSFEHYLKLSIIPAILLAAAVFGYFSQIINPPAGGRAALVTVLLWLGMTSFAWLRLHRNLSWQRCRSWLHRIS